MARAEKPVRGRARLARDSQQWMLDYLVQETGKVFHFQGDGRGRLPRSVRSHDMISKHVGLQARRTEALAQAEAAAGHPETALDFYIPGCDTLKEAWPHPFFNATHQRGMHVFSFDGPGQAESNLRGIRLSVVRRGQQCRTQ